LVLFFSKGAFILLVPLPKKINKNKKKNFKTQNKKKKKYLN